MTTVLLFGASGYVGGQVLKELSRSTSQFKVTAVFRDAEVASKIAAAYPDLRTVVGTLDDSDLIEAEAAKASIVLNAASNKHMGAARAIHSGLGKKDSASYWIQISGASALAVAELAAPSYEVGLHSDVTFDDLDGIDKVRSLIKAHPSRELDNYVLGVHETNPNIHTALIFAPMIYGKGEGPVKQRSVQLPSLAKVALERGHAVRVGSGLNRWGNSHVADVGRLFTGLAKEAEKGNVDQLWGDSGIYLTSKNEMTFAEVSDRIKQTALDQGLITTSDVEQLSKDESNTALPAGSVLFGTNARGNARRAEALFGWKPQGASLEDEIPKTVAEEAARRSEERH